MAEQLEICLRCYELREQNFFKEARKKAGERTPKKIVTLRETTRAARSEQASKIAERKERGDTAAVRALVDVFKRYDANAAARFKKEVTPVLDKMRRRKVRVRLMPWADVQRDIAEEYRKKGRPEITARRVKAYRLAHADLHADLFKAMREL